MRTLILILMVLQLSITYAKKEPNRKIRQILPDTGHSKTIGKNSFHSTTGIPTTLTKVGYKAQSSLPEAIAREYLAENYGVLQLKQNHLDELQLTNIRQGLASTTVRFKQFYQGIEVFDSSIAISFNRKNTVNYVNNSLKPVANLRKNKNTITKSDALAVALTYLGSAITYKTSSPATMVYFDGKSYINTYQVKSQSNTMHGNWMFIIDSETAEILVAKDTLHYQNASGTVFDPDPLSSAGVNYGGGYVDNNDSTTSQLNNELFTKGLQLNTSGSQFLLTSDRAEAVDVSPPNDGVFSQSSSSFNYDRADPAFEFVNTYYHIDTFLNYLNEDLGLTVKPFQYSTGIKFDAHGDNGADNSFYSGAGLLVFGEGCVDDAEDADVVIHELGHGIHDWLTVGNLSQVNGLSEGTGDYFAQSYSRKNSNQTWNSNQAAYHYMFSWDGHNECWAGRTTNYDRVYPSGLVGQIHTDGQIWASCLMKVWDQIGAEDTDTIVVEGLAMTGSNTNQEQAAQAVLQAAVNLNMSQHVGTIQSTFQGCGYNVAVVSNISANIISTGDSTTENNQEFSVEINGGVPPYSYAWDVNNDGKTDGIDENISANYQQTYNQNVSVTVTDSESASTTALLSVNIAAPEINLLTSTSSASQTCGNNDNFIDPGEQWQIPVSIQNNGFADAESAYAVFLKKATSLDLQTTVQDSFGNAAGSCDRNFIDISNTGTELTITDANPNDSFDAEDEGVAAVSLNTPFDFYGETISSLYLSTNGFISIDPNESGFDFDNSCPLPEATNNGNSGSTNGARIIPLHDDLITQHIYHQHFNICPRQSALDQDLSCDIFMYQDVDIFDTSNSTVEHFNFEAILYPSNGQWVFQYDGVGYNPASSSVGIQNTNATDGLGFSCNNTNGINNQQAVCVYHKDSLTPTGNVDYLNLETPVLAMGDLPVSNQFNGLVEFSVNQEAECGSAINIEMQAAVYEQGFNQDGSDVISTTLGNNGVCSVVTNCSTNGENDINATNGIWDNIKRPGNGYDMYYIGQSLVYVHYTAMADRSSIWYLTGGPNNYQQNNQAYNELYKFSYDGPFLTSNQSRDLVGNSLTTLVNANTAILTRKINGKFSADIIQPLVFGSTPSEQRTGIWYNDDEDGWGFSIGTQSNNEVNVSYIYDNSGQPFWLLGSGQNEAVENIEMKYFYTFCPHCPTVSPSNTNVGTARINYQNSNLDAILENMQIDINDGIHDTQWNRNTMPLRLLTPTLQE